jgi:hypothetical protein
MHRLSRVCSCEFIELLLPDSYEHAALLTLEVQLLGRKSSLTLPREGGKVQPARNAAYLFHSADD